MLETVRTNELATAPVAAKKVTDVSLVHDVVRPAVLPSCAVWDRSIGPKFAPETRKAPPEVPGMLLDPEVILAESNVKLLSKHPTVSESVTATCCACPYPAPVAQLTVVEEDQLVVRQRNDRTAEVMVRYCAAKSRPEIVTTAPPDVGELGTNTEDATGASKLNAAVLVPTSAPTVAVTNTDLPPCDGTESHTRVVPVVQEVVLQGMCLISAELVRSYTPKLNPDRVRLVLPEMAAFELPVVMAGLSKLKTLSLAVPTTAPTVSAALRSSGETAAEATTHTMLVGLRQEADWHDGAPSLAEGVAPSDAEPKLRPAKVKKPPPETGMFRVGSVDVMTGGSKEKRPVPTKPLTVTVVASRRPPLTAGLTQRSEVPVDQEVVAHALPI